MNVFVDVPDILKGIFASFPAIINIFRVIKDYEFVFVQFPVDQYNYVIYHVINYPNSEECLP